VIFVIFAAFAELSDANIDSMERKLASVLVVVGAVGPPPSFLVIMLWKEAISEERASDV
jgi:hypothetical protein